ncbi:MAG: hypothetical protein U5R31_17335 [Acidimicrobiia bacterium]|nr:hypothetical protein [Acidimicrobiia bacterium]
MEPDQDAADTTETSGASGTNPYGHLPPPPTGTTTTPGTAGDRRRRLWTISGVAVALVAILLAGVVVFGSEGDDTATDEGNGRTATRADSADDEGGTQADTSDSTTSTTDPDPASTTADAEGDARGGDHEASGGDGSRSPGGRRDAGGARSTDPGRTANRGAGGTSGGSATGDLVVTGIVELPEGVTHGEAKVRNDGGAALDGGRRSACPATGSPPPRVGSPPASPRPSSSSSWSRDADSATGPARSRSRAMPGPRRSRSTADSPFPGGSTSHGTSWPATESTVTVPVRHTGDLPVRVDVRAGSGVESDVASFWLEPGEVRSVRITSCARPFVPAGQDREVVGRDVRFAVGGTGADRVEVVFMFLPGGAVNGC